MATYEQLRAELRRIAPWLIPVISTASANGAVAYLVDTALWQDASSVGLTAKTLNNMWLMLPDAASAGDRERQIGGNSGSPLDVSNGRIYPKVAWANAPQSGAQYELSALQPRLLFDLLVETMENFLQPTYAPLPRFTDADMEETNTTSWTLSGAGSVSKVTAQANVYSGSQALFFNAGTAGEYVEGPSVRVLPSSQYFASMTARVDAGGPFYFAIWDKTNNAEIMSGSRVSHALERFMSMQRDFTTPATCEEIAVRGYVTAATDDVYIDSVHGPWKQTDSILPAPSGLLRPVDLRKLYAARYDDTHASNLYDADSRRFEAYPRLSYHLRVDRHHAHASRLELQSGYRLTMGEQWVEYLRKASEITTLAFTAAGETSPTTALDKRLIALAWAKRVCEHILAYLPSDTEAKATLGKVSSELGPLMKNYEQELETPQYPDPHPLAGRSLSGV